MAVVPASVSYLPVTPEPDLVDVGQGLLVPETFRAELSDDHFPGVVIVTIRVHAGIPVCDEITVRRAEGGPAVTTETLARIPLAKLVHQLVGDVAIVPTEAGDWGDLDRERVRWVRLSLAPDTVQHRVTRQLRRRVTDDLLERVAGTYREALAAGEYPTVAVKERESVSHSTAARYVAAARARGLLGPTTAGKAGEAKEDQR